MVDFAGWNLPVQYTGVIEEHKAVRTGCGLFDASHMGEAIVEGARAVEFLNAAFTNEFSSLKIWSARYTVFCNPDGTCADDIIVYRLSENAYMLVLNASNTEKDLSLLADVAKGFSDVSLVDVSDTIALLSVQGPTSQEVMGEVFGADFSRMRRFTFVKLGDDIISRTGYTGSDGFEIFCPTSSAETLAEKICETDKVALCGLGARDSLRTEACYPLYGHEISDAITPLEAGLEKFVNFSKNFVGSEALLKQRESGLKKKVFWFAAQGRRIVRAGDEIFCGDSVAGRALSGVWSATAERPLGSALLGNRKYIGEHLYAKIRDNIINLELRGK